MKTAFPLKEKKMLKKSWLPNHFCGYMNKCAHISPYAFITMYKCVSVKTANARTF